MSLNSGSIVVVNALYTYRLIGPNSQGVKRASLMHTVIPVAITAIYLSKQGVSDLGYTQAHVSFHL